MAPLITNPFANHREQLRMRKTGDIIHSMCLLMAANVYDGSTLSSAYVENCREELNERFTAFDNKHFEHVQNDLNEHHKEQRK